MIQTNLIMIEGLWGSGKSATAQQLCRHLREQGVDASWIFEQQEPHPIRVDSKPEHAPEHGSDGELTRILEQALLNWQSLANSLTDTQSIMILESVLFPTTTGIQLLTTMSGEDVTSFVLSCERVIEKLAPVLIYFRQNDVHLALQKVNLIRGALFSGHLLSQLSQTTFGRKPDIQSYEGVIKAAEKLRGLTDRIFDRLRMRKLAIENSTGDWNRYYREITDFLSLPPIDIPFAPPANANKLAGEYRPDGSHKEFTIALDGRGLFVRGEMQMRLIAKTERTFDIEGIPVALEFETDRQGIARAVEFSGNFPDLPQVWRRSDGRTNAH
jgi:hypothetical protein